MTPKRHAELIDNEPNAMFMTMVTFRHAKVTDEAVAMELRRLDKLYKVKVVSWKLSDNGHNLLLMLCKRENTMTAEEAAERNEAYDGMLKMGLPATADQPAVPARKVWRPHRYPAGKLFDVPSFMHDLLHAVCDRSEWFNRRKNSQPESRTDVRPYVFGKYKCIRVQPDCIPRIFSAGEVEKMAHILQGLGYDGTVRRAPEDAPMYVSRRAAGSREFVRKTLEYEDRIGETFKRKEEKRLKPVREPSVDELRRIVACSKQYYEEMLRFNLDESLAAEAFESIMYSAPGNYALGLLFSAAPFLGALMLYDGMNRWISLARMKRSGTLSRLAYTATRRACDLIMTS